MKIYLAGNFVQMNKVENEVNIQKRLPHNRLTSFYFLNPWTLNVIKALKELKGIEDYENIPCFNQNRGQTDTS